MIITDIAGFIGYYDSARQRTRRVIGHIPPERIEWRPAAGKFSFGDVVRHLAAIERWMWAENVQGRPSRYPGHGPELADGHEAVLAYFERLGAESRAMFASLADTDLQRGCQTPAGASLPVWKWLRAMFEHEAHHRGQLHLMLGLIGASAPPLFGLTSEQVRERSR
jgi:uncharacterized damage-inducible protein DinB